MKNPIKIKKDPKPVLYCTLDTPTLEPNQLIPLAALAGQTLLNAAGKHDIGAKFFSQAVGTATIDSFADACAEFSDHLVVMAYVVGTEEPTNLTQQALIKRRQAAKRRASKALEKAQATADTLRSRHEGLKREEEKILQDQELAEQKVAEAEQVARGIEDEIANLEFEEG